MARCTVASCEATARCASNAANPVSARLTSSSGNGQLRRKVGKGGVRTVQDASSDGDGTGGKCEKCVIAACPACFRRRWRSARLRHASPPDPRHLLFEAASRHFPPFVRRAATAMLFSLAAVVDAQQMDSQPMTMPMAGALGISMDRMGSGTTWIPDAVSLPSRHLMAGGWMLMLHGFAFGQYDHQSGPRGGHQVGSLNWGMVMADHDLAGGRVQLRFMPSLDPWTVSA